MTLLLASIDTFRRLGSIRFDGEIGVGGTTLESSFQVEPGDWTVLYLDSEAIEELIESGRADLEHVAGQLVLFNSAVPESENSTATQGTEVARTAIEGARFTIADIVWRKRLTEQDAFDEHLDGKDGLLDAGQGVTIMLEGDGGAVTRIEARASGARWCIVDVR